MKKSGIAICAAMALAAAGSLVWAGISTREERIQESGLNPSNCTWRAQVIFVRPSALAGSTGTPATVGFRCDVVLNAKPSQAVMTLLAKGTDHKYPFEVRVNGQRAVSTFPVADGIMQVADLRDFLQPGTNVLTVSAAGIRANGWFSLTAQGRVFCEDGSIINLQTGTAAWRGGWGNLPQNWDQANVALTNVPALEGWGIMKWGGDSPRCNPRYDGCIQVALPKDMPEPVFAENKPVEWRVLLMNAAQAPTVNRPLPVLSYEILNELTRTIIGQGTINLKPEGKLDLTGELKAGVLPKGAYRFRFHLTSGTNRLDQRDYEIACIGQIKQHQVEGTHYEDGMELKEIWSVDCTREPKADEFIALYEIARGETPLETRVVEGPAGKYREMVKPEIYSHFAYRFKVRNLFMPHLAVVEWPDDAPRQIVAQVVEGETMIPEGFGAFGRGYGFTRGEASVMATDDYPRSNKMKKMHFIYWPNEEDESFHIFNYHGKAPAAAARLSIYEIVNDIPALRIKDGGDRLAGYHTERGPYTMGMTYYSGPLGAAFPLLLGWGDQEEFYRNWYTTTENLIKRMRFGGQNLYVMGHFMYYDAPSHLSYPSPRFSTKRPARDYIAFIARMFAANGMALSSCVEFLNTRALIRESAASIEEVRAGAPTLFTVTKDGEFINMVGNPVVNFFHPRVQESILGVLGELADLYRDYPAWKGVTLIVNSTFCGPLARFVKDPLDSGYEDYTISLFEKDTGLKAPVDAKDPQRFFKRYEWMTSDPVRRQQWIDWKAKQFTQMFRSYRDRLVKARPDLKLYLCMREPQAGRINTYFKDKLNNEGEMAQSLKLLGYDAKALKKEPGIVTSFMFISPGTKQGHEARDVPMWRDLARSQDWNNLFANDGKGGAYIFSGFTEGNRYIAKGKWIWQFAMVRQGYPWPPDEYAMDVFVNTFVRANPTVMPHTWADVNDPGGHLQEQRLFARAFRSLPNGNYERLHGNGLDTNLWVETCRQANVEYAYAANPQWWPLDEVTLVFAEGVEVYDLIADKPVKLTSGKWIFRLGPYEIRTFRVLKGPKAEGSEQREPSAIKGAVSRPAASGKAALDGASGAIRKQLDRAHAREADLKSLPGWAKVSFLEEQWVSIELLKAAGRVDEGFKLSVSSPVTLAQKSLEYEALQAVSFAVLGPFGGTNLTDMSIYGGEVSKNFNTMETPWIGEFAGTNWTMLVANFKPDFDAANQVYPDKPARWQPVVKSYFLSFFNTCHSAVPFWMAAYGWTEIYSPEDRAAIVLAGSDHAVWIWFNDRLVLKHGGQDTHRGGQRPSRPDQNIAQVVLKQGWNRVLVKAMQRGETRIFFRLTDNAGNAMEDLKYRIGA